MINRTNSISLKRTQTLKNLPPAEKSQAAEEKHSSIPYNNSYAVAFLGKKDYTQNEKEFFNFKKAVYRRRHKVSIATNNSRWNYWTNLTEQNKQESTDAFIASMRATEDMDVEKKLKDFGEKGITDSVLKKHYKTMCREYLSNNISLEEVKELKRQENDILEKINNYSPEVNGVKYTKTELYKILETEKNPKLRKEFYEASEVKCGDFIAKDLVNLVKSRNKAAQNAGYKDFYEYKIATSNEDVSEEKLFEILDDLEKKTTEIYNKFNAIEAEKLAEAHGIQQKDLMPWHYGLELEDDCMLKVDKYFNNPQNTIEIINSICKKMGYNLKPLPITFDIFPRKNKVQNAFCLDANKNKDIRILANVNKSFASFSSAFHETGHALYSANISEHLPYVERNYASFSMTEAVAMLFQKILTAEKVFVKELGFTDELAEKLKLEMEKTALRSVRQKLTIINFEREMYKNPDQDLAELWFKMNNKLRGRNIPTETGNVWANTIHYITNPAYYPNYQIADLIKEQLYETAHKKLGDLTKNSETASFLNKKIFRHGASVSQNELIKKITGKDLSAESFCKQFEALAKHLK